MLRRDGGRDALGAFGQVRDAYGGTHVEGGGRATGVRENGERVERDAYRSPRKERGCGFYPLGGEC